MSNSLDGKLVRTSPVLWLLGLVFALLLGGLGTRALVDIADVFDEPQLDFYQDQRVRELNAELQRVQSAPNPIADQVTRAQRDLDDLERTLGSAEENFRTWLETRATLGGTQGEDTEVRRRRDRLEALRKERDDAARKLADLRGKPDPKTARIDALNRQIEAASREAEAEFDAAHRRWAWKVLSARLALVIPIWLLAAWLWARRRNTKYLTLLWGYWAFSIWMLLYGIGPYLPHYGGYFPLALGSAVTVWASVSLVRWFNRRAPIRRRRIVDNAIARHVCPGCDRDYLIGREVGLDRAVTRKATVRHFDAPALRPRACPSCALPLFGACAGCQHEQLVHFPNCAACGAEWKTAA